MAYNYRGIDGFRHAAQCPADPLSEGEKERAYLKKMRRRKPGRAICSFCMRRTRFSEGQILPTVSGSFGRHRSILQPGFFLCGPRQYAARRQRRRRQPGTPFSPVTRAPVVLTSSLWRRPDGIFCLTPSLMWISRAGRLIPSYNTMHGLKNARTIPLGILKILADSARAVGSMPDYPTRAKPGTISTPTTYPV